MNPWAARQIELLERADFWSANNKGTLREEVNKLIKQYNELDELLTVVLEAQE